MNIKIVKNKYLNALFLLMLFSAIVHMIILFFLAITQQNTSLINYFNILNISYFLPQLAGSFQQDVVSFVFTAAIYLVILKANKDG